MPPDLREFRRPKSAPVPATGKKGRQHQSGRGDRRHQRMVQIDFENRFGADAAVLPRQQPLKFAIGAMAAGDQTRRARGEALRGADIGDAIAKVQLDRGDNRRLVGVGFALILLAVVEQRNQREVDIALTQGFQRLAFEIKRCRAPERIDRIGEKQNLDAASGPDFSLGFPFSRSMLSPARK